MGFLTAHATIRFSRPGVMPYPRGEYSPSVTDYRWDGDRRDVVHYNGIWYAVKKFDPTGYVPAGQYPSASSAYWTVTSQFEIVITSMMMADAIRTNALNVNDKFVVNTDGSVSTEGTFSSVGRAGNGQETKCLIDDGGITIFNNTNFQEKIRMTVDTDTGRPEICLGSYVGGGGGIYQGEGFVLGSKEGNLVFNANLIGAGTVYVKEDGTLALLKGAYTGQASITISASPASWGKVQPSGTLEYPEGVLIEVQAIPNIGYRFDRWSDGGAQTHSVSVTDGMELTAYFAKEEEDTVNYTVTLSASPTAGGTVSGGGTYAKGTVRTVTATPNPGYIFIRWSDGGAQSHSVAWDSTKSLVAYFEKYTVTTRELFSGTELTSGTYWSKSGSSVIISVANGTANSTFHNGDLTSYVAFNKGYLSGKIKQGHKYRLTMNVQSSVAETAFVGVLGEGLDVSKTVNGEALFYGNLMNDGVISTSPKTLTADFTATERGSTANDAFIFTVSQACVISINSISLKEIST